MQLLGPYNSKLQAFHYQELLDLYKLAVASGDFAANATFDEATVNTLVKQSQDFANLPLASAGQRVTEDSLNNPLALLTARFNSLVAEANDFDSRAAGLIAVLQKDTNLLDQLLSAAALEAWAAQQPILHGATEFSWDYGQGNGPASSEITQVDPANSVSYPSKCPTNTYLDVTDGSVYTGLVAPDTRVAIDAKNLQWQWTPMTAGEQGEDLYGDGWAELNLLEDRPLINFLPDPTVQVILPSGGSVDSIFSIQGNVAGGSLPIYVRTLFTPRRNQTTLTPFNAITDGSFESGGTGWTLNSGWTTASSGAHTGTMYLQKAPLSLWNASHIYSIGNAVRFNNKEYIAIAGSIGQEPDAIGSTYWAEGGVLESPTFQLSPLDQIYVEAWLKNFSADGIVNISLTCLDHAGVPISPDIYLPEVTSANDWLEISGILQALDNQTVVSGRISVRVYGQTAGTWGIDDVRVHTPQNLSPYVVNQDDVAVFIPKTDGIMPLNVFFDNQDFIVDDVSNVTFQGLPDGVPLVVRFTENYPGYQCSVNETVWSPLVMLDVNRPYPDTEKNFDPIQIGVDSLGNRTLFPITDETGVPTGLTLQVLSRPLYEYYFQVTTTALPQYGATAVLEIDLTKPTYMNGLTIAPFSTFPVRLTKFEVESFTADTRQAIGAPNALIDRPMVLTFPTTLVRKIFLTCYQENYTLKEYVVQPPDALRRDTLFALQTVLPFNVRRPSRAVPVYYRGAQYAFGLENIAGINTTPVLPGIFIAGAHKFKGCPDIFRFDCSTFDGADFDVFLCWKAYDASGNILQEELTGQQITPGACQVWPFPSPSILDRSSVNHVDIFLKFVLRNEEVVLQRYLLQVTNV